MHYRVNINNTVSNVLSRRSEFNAIIASSSPVHIYLHNLQYDCMTEPNPSNIFISIQAGLPLKSFPLSMELCTTKTIFLCLIVMDGDKNYLINFMLGFLEDIPVTLGRTRGLSEVLCSLVLRR